MWPKTFHKPQRDRNPQEKRVRIVSESSRKFRVVVPLPKPQSWLRKEELEGLRSEPQKGLK